MSTKNLRRRQFIQIGAGVGMATAGIGTVAAQEDGGETADGESCNPEEQLDCTWSGEPDYGVSYLIGRVKAHFFGLGTEDNYEQAEARSLYLQARSDAGLISAGNESVLTSITNLAENARSVAYQQGRAAYLEAVNDGTSPINALQPGRKAVQEYITPNQRNVIERWNVMFEQVKLIVDRARETEGTNPGKIFNGGDLNFAEVDPENPRSNHGQKNYTLVDGETMFADGMRWDKRGYFGNNVYAYIAIDETTRAGPNDDSGAGTVDLKADPETDGSEKIVVINHRPFKKALDSLKRAYEDAYSDLEAFAQGIQDEYVAGAIDTEDLVTPRDLWEMSSDDAENPYAAADLAGLGLEVNQSSSITVDLLDDERLIDGSVYLSQSPIGESLSVGTVYDPTASRQTDDDGNPTDSTDSYEGTVDDPVPLDGLTYIAYNTDDGGSTYSQIQQPFEVVDAVGEDGETLDDVSYAPSGGQQTTTTDINELREELQAMNDEINELEDQRREAATGGGISLGIGGDISPGVVGGVVAALAALAALGGGRP